MNRHNHLSLKAGTTGGAILSTIVNINPGDLLKTAIMAAIGASVSFSVSLAMGRLVKWYKSRDSKKH